MSVKGQTILKLWIFDRPILKQYLFPIHFPNKAIYYFLQLYPNVKNRIYFT